MHRRTFCRRLLATPAFLATPALLRSAMAQEASTIVLGSQQGLPYLPLMVMEALKLVEKHAARLGMASLRTEYNSAGGPAALVDALLSGRMSFGIVGMPSVATLWDKTAGTPNEIRALCAAQSMPFMLVTNNPAVKSIRDFTERDKIAVPSAKISAQAVCLQIAVAKEWGQEQYARLDPLTISLPHPDAAAAIIAKSPEVAGHYSVAPFYYYELAASDVHTVLRSYDTLGGPATNGALLMAKKFRDASPKVTQAVYAALTDANAFINATPREAAAIYMKAANEKRSSLDEMTKMIADPDNVWTTVPQNSMKYAEFMHKIGSIKRLPGSWHDLFMPEAHELKGS